MRNIWLILLVLFLFLCGVCFIYLRTDLFPMEIGLVSDIYSFSKYPEVSWNDVTNGKLNKALHRDYELGIIPHFSELAAPIETYRQINQPFFNNQGYGFVELFDGEVLGGKYLNPITRPFKFVAYYKTNINRKDYFILIILWLNKDKSVSFVPMIVPESVYLVDGKIDQRYIDLVAVDSKYFPSPVMKIRDVKTCLAIMNAGGEYCSWFVGQQSKYNNLISKWFSKKMIPNSIGRYPVFILQTPLYIVTSYR